MAKYVYPAIFLEEEGGYSVTFPDIENCFTCADTMHDAIMMAEDALNLMLCQIEDDGVTPNPPTDIKDITVDEKSVVSLIAADTIEYRKVIDCKAVKKTLTIPNWLNIMSEKANLNFSQVLQEALMQKLDIS